MFCVGVGWVWGGLQFNSRGISAAIYDCPVIAVYRLTKMARVAAASVGRTISTGDGGVSGVVGLTRVDDELFVLLDRTSDQLAVHSCTVDDDFQLLRRVNLPALRTYRARETRLPRYRRELGTSSFFRDPA